MMMHMWSGGGGPWFVLFPWLWIGLIVLAVVLVRRGRGRWNQESAVELLRERYARGDIPAEEYRERLAVLRGKGS